MRRVLVAALASGLPLFAHAQTPTQALAAKWNTICATAVGGTLLYQRCDETLTSPDPNANVVAAIGQRLEEIPGQARVATRDQVSLPGAVRVDLGGGISGTLSELPGGGLRLNLDESLASNWSLFLSADLGRVSRQRSPNEAAFDAKTWSATAGVDWRPAAGWQLGAAYSHSQEALDYRQSAGSADTQFGGLLLIASRELGPNWLLHGYAGRLQGDYALRREISYRITRIGPDAVVQAMATANPDARRELAGLALNRAWSRGAWSASAELGGDWTRTRIDPYSETGGAGVALSVPGREISTRRGRIDLHLDRTASFSWGVWQLGAGLGWRREFANPRRQLTVNLAEDPLRNGVRFDTEDPDRGWGELALSSAFTFAGGQSGFIEYRQRLAHDFLGERILALGWRIELD